MKSVLSLLWCLGFCFLARGQFIPYTLYANSPVLTNAGYPGTHDNQELWLNYRQSRVANNQSSALTYSHPLHSKIKGQFGGVSATVINESWANGLYAIRAAEAGFAYSVKFSSRILLSMGMQAAANMRSWDGSKITTSSQYVQGRFDADIPTDEQFNSMKERLFGLHAGLLFRWKDRAGNSNAQLGLSARNINKPEHKMTSNRNRETVTYILSGSIKLWEQGRTVIEPSMRYYHYKEALANIGTMVHYRANEKITVTAGLWYKTNRSLAAMMQISNEPLVVACGFDLGAAQKLSGENNNAFEVSLAWKIKNKKREE